MFRNYHLFYPHPNRSAFNSYSQYIVHFSEVICPDPPDVLYSERVIGGRKLGDVTKYTCEPGMRTEDGSQSQNITCLVEEIWSDTRITCAREYGLINKCLKCRFIRDIDKWHITRTHMSQVAEMHCQSHHTVNIMEANDLAIPRATVSQSMVLALFVLNISVSSPGR